MQIPKNDSAYRLLQAPTYSRVGSVSVLDSGFWGTLISIAAVGLLTVTLFNRL